MQEPSPDPTLSPEGFEAFTLALDLLPLPPAILSLDDMNDILASAPSGSGVDEDPPPAAWETTPAITLDPPSPSSSAASSSSSASAPNRIPATPSPALLLPPGHPQPQPQTQPQTQTQATPLHPPIIPGITLLPPNPEASRTATWIRTLTPYFPAAAGFAIYPTIKVCPRTHVMYDLVIVHARHTGPYLTTVMGPDCPPESDAWARRVQVLQEEWRHGVADGMPVYGAVWVGSEVRWFCGGEK